MLRVKELELNATVSPQPLQPLFEQVPDFDVSRNICLFPVFLEKDVDKYCVLFERVATTLKWP